MPLLALVAGQIGQYLLRRRAELLLAEVQSLELRKTPWPEAQQQFQHWAANRKFDDACNEHQCSLKITLLDLVYGSLSRTNGALVRLDDYFRWRFKLSYEIGPFVRMQQALVLTYMRAGGRPGGVVATIGMRNGVVWSKGFYVRLETYVHPRFFGGAGNTFVLMADTQSIPRFGENGVYWNDDLMHHPNYLIGGPNACLGCVDGWAKFTPYADPADIHRLMQFDLSCLTRWHPCLTQSDIMPAAWAQYLAENARSDEPRYQPGCPPFLIEMLGRDTDIIAAVEILKYRETVDSWSDHRGTASIRVLERLKALADWKPGETRKVSIWFGTDAENGKLRAGSRLIFFGSKGSSQMLIVPDRACPVVTANETNLRLVRRGIDQDYSAMDQAE